jgi:DNA-binding response OmpR family regulator
MIDDDELFRNIMTDALTERGFEVVGVRDGIEGIDKIQSEPFKLVLLDLLLPKMTGFDVLKEIRKDKSGPALPILAVSGVYRTEEHIAALREFGANGFISKDASPAQIADRVIRTLEVTQAEKAATTDEVKESAAPAAQKEAAEPAALDPAQAFEKIQVFKELDQGERVEILKISKKVKFQRGQVIIREGEEGDEFYGIISGTVRVEKKEVSGDSTVLARLGPGTGFGELALVDQDKRSATCIAESEVEALAISRGEFEKALAKDPDLERKCLRALLGLMSQRLRETDTSLTFSRSLLDRMIETE